MNVILLGAPDSAVERVREVLGDNVSTEVSGSHSADEWPIVVAWLSEEAPEEDTRRIRGLVGPSAMLVGVCASHTCDASSLIHAGLDDLEESVHTFLVRYPFFAERLRLRLQRALRLEAIMENTVDGIVVIDERGRIQSINQAVTRIFGYEAEDLVGKNVSVLMPSPDAERHDGYLSRYLETRVAKIIGIGREVIGKRRDGSLFPLDLAVSETRLEGRSIFAGVIRDVSERRRLESEILRASDEERRRIGQDLHDGLGQMLTGIGLIAQNVGRQLRDGGIAAAKDVEEISDLIREADEQARILARGLVPVELDRDGLATALDRLCARASRLFGGCCSFDRRSGAVVHDGSAATNLYRIAQEAVSNAFKHGHADKVTVCLETVDSRVRLRIQDNGIGFPEVLEESRGMGVRIMHYRAGVIGGKLEILRLDDGGTVVSCDIPGPSAPYQTV